MANAGHPDPAVPRSDRTPPDAAEPVLAGSAAAPGQVVASRDVPDAGEPTRGVSAGDGSSPAGAGSSPDNTAGVRSASGEAAADAGPVPSETTAAASPGTAPAGGAVPGVATSARRPRSAADRAALRMAGIVGGLIVALLGGFALGRAAAAPPPAPRTPTHTHAAGTPGHGHGGTAGVNGESVVGGAANGLASVAAGYRIVPESTVLPAGVARPFAFRIHDAAGAPVTRFVDSHERKLHLIVVRRDLGGYQHLHPTMAADGRWQVPLRLSAAGPWHAYADFVAADAAGKQTPVTLGVGLTAAGVYAPAPLPAPVAATAVGGYRVTVDGASQVRAGSIHPVQFRVTRAGVPARLDRDRKSIV